MKKKVKKNDREVKKKEEEKKVKKDEKEKEKRDKREKKEKEVERSRAVKEKKKMEREQEKQERKELRAKQKAEKKREEEEKKGCKWDHGEKADLLTVAKAHYGVDKAKRKSVLLHTYCISTLGFRRMLSLKLSWPMLTSNNSSCAEHRQLGFPRFYVCRISRSHFG